ncbi:type I restriction enzyme HsdR N-terminal domain-containing protein [uncultured Nonlabens sp.]|uniref:type I restriction enzyme HsdR N-terminal domain-containing protein n=1 Tax=uncultured Nonlabens sp. TaxID=859306 RepID=UPI002636F73E|nr:type I restriction enzyme HsdR N-terminal domain-containing protein [uncultured Nonlabens sp.]
MKPLRLPAGNFRVKSTEKGRAIFDQIRKKFVILTPEEWVRQHVVLFLLSRKRIPKNLLNVEKQLIIAGTSKRYDILSYNTDGSIHLIVECKAPEVRIDQSVFDQIARYNLAVKAQYLMVTNGIDHYFCTMDYEKETYNFITDLPQYNL